MDEIVYLLWSNKHSMWWRPNSLGYTEVEDEAGRYSRDEAINLVARSADCGVLAQVTCMVAAPDNWKK